MKRKRSDINNTRSRGTTTIVQLPDNDCLKKEQGVATPCSGVADGHRQEAPQRDVLAD